MMSVAARHPPCMVGKRFSGNKPFEEPFHRYGKRPVLHELFAKSGHAAQAFFHRYRKNCRKFSISTRKFAYDCGRQEGDISHSQTPFNFSTPFGAGRRTTCDFLTRATIGQPDGHGFRQGDGERLRHADPHLRHGQPRRHADRRRFRRWRRSFDSQDRDGDSDGLRDHALPPADDGGAVVAGGLMTSCVVTNNSIVRRFGESNFTLPKTRRGASAHGGVRGGFARTSKVLCQYSIAPLARASSSHCLYSPDSMLWK